MWGKYVRHGLRLGCRVNVVFLWFFGFGMNGEFLPCDAYVHNTTLFAVVVCACGANMCGIDCVCGSRVVDSVNVVFFWFWDE